METTIIYAAVSVIGRTDGKNINTSVYNNKYNARARTGRQVVKSSLNCCRQKGDSSRLLLLPSFFYLHIINNPFKTEQEEGAQRRRRRNDERLWPFEDCAVSILQVRVVRSVVWANILDDAAASTLKSSVGYCRCLIWFAIHVAAVRTFFCIAEMMMMLAACQRTTNQSIVVVKVDFIVFLSLSY